MRTVGNLKTFFIPGLDLSASGAASKLWVFATDAAGMTFTRSGDQTYISSGGTVETVTTDVSAHQDGGILLEGAATNLVWDSFSPATQTRTVTAVEHTLSIKGSGSVVLSGVASGTATEAAPLTFTPTAGGLTMTVSGSVEVMQLETGGFATSFIETPAGASASRSATNLTTAYAFPANGISGHIKVRPQFSSTDDRNGAEGLLDLRSSVTGADDDISIYYNNSVAGRVSMKVSIDNVDTYIHSPAITWNSGDSISIRFRKDSSGASIWLNSEAVGSSATPSSDYTNKLDTITLNAYNAEGSSLLSQAIESLQIWDEAKSDEFLEALS